MGRLADKLEAERPEVPLVIAALAAVLLATHPPVRTPFEDWRARL